MYFGLFELGINQDLNQQAILRLSANVKVRTISRPQQYLVWCFVLSAEF
jgi:hypothetical protein